MRDSYLVFGQPRIEEAEIEEVVASLRAAWLGTGPKVAAFEKLVAEYKGASHAVAVNSCTAGLHLACVALGLKPGDEVIVPAMTFCATVNAIIHAGATPVIADVDPVTFNLSPDEVERRITAAHEGTLARPLRGPCVRHGSAADHRSRTRPPHRRRLRARHRDRIPRPKGRNPRRLRHASASTRPRTW